MFRIMVKSLRKARSLVTKFGWFNLCLYIHPHLCLGPVKISAVSNHHMMEISTLYKSALNDEWTVSFPIFLYHINPEPQVGMSSLWQALNTDVIQPSFQHSTPSKWSVQIATNLIAGSKTVVITAAHLREEALQMPQCTSRGAHCFCTGVTSNRKWLD
jgi:hypothetical protein